MTQSDCSVSTAGSECTVCGKAFVSNGRRVKKCSDECRKIDARRRAMARHEALKGTPEYESARKAATRRRYEKVCSDTELLAEARRRTAEWRTANRDAIRDYERRYREQNRLAVREKNQRRRARLLGAWVEDVDTLALWERSSGLCGICGLPIDLTLGWPSGECLTVDHIVPLSKGGLHSMANTQPAHARCNSRKSDRLN